MQEDNTTVKQSVMVKDWRGRELAVGDHIVYPVRYGSRVYLSEARINDILVISDSNDEDTVQLKVTRIAESGYDYFGDGRIKQTETTISALDRVTKVEA